MEGPTALKIIQSLAAGIDPQTGEAFAPGSAYQQPETIRALFLAARALEAQPAAKSNGAHENAGKPWSDDEDQALASEFDAGTGIADLADAHKRSRVAIEARLAKLGKITLPANSPVLKRVRIAAPAPRTARDAAMQMARYCA
jgi:hypothetical protein